VRVVRQDGNYTDSDPRRVIVANRRPVESPTPAVTQAPTEAPSTPLPVPTVAIVAPTVQLPRGSVTPTVQTKTTPTPTPLIGEARATPASSTGGLLDTKRLADAAEKAATYTLGLFVVVGAFFAVKAVLAWIWHKIRP